LLILQYLLYGLVMGLSQILPVSSLAHSRLYCMLTGIEETPLLALFSHVGILAALLFHFAPQLKRIRQEMQIASSKKHRRLRQPDLAAVSDGRIFSMSWIPFAAAMVLSGFISDYFKGLLPLALLLLFNGALLYSLQFQPEGNRSSREMSPADGLLLGLCGIAALIPGLSRMTATLTIGQRRGIERGYLTDMALLLAIPFTIILVVMDVIGLFAGFSITWIGIIGMILSAGAAFGGAYGAVSLMQYLAVRIGFHGFAFYSLGTGFLCFILYLMI
jgi:undecaprenyl pyrophosphate phosphatase UppP